MSRGGATRIENCSSPSRVLNSGIEGEPLMDLHSVAAAVPSPIYSPAPLPVEEFVAGIRALSEGLITKTALQEYLVSYEIRQEDLEQFRQWLPDRHTRNKIF